MTKTSIVKLIKDDILNGESKEYKLEGDIKLEIYIDIGKLYGDLYTPDGEHESSASVEYDSEHKENSIEKLAEKIKTLHSITLTRVRAEEMS